MMDPAVVRASHATLAHHGRTFRLAGHLLPRARRDDAAVVYAFCRRVDDAVDEAPDREAARHALARLESGLSGDAPADPLTAAFLDVCARRSIPPVAARELIRGVGSDMGVVRLEDDAALLRYAYRVAGTVGLMMCGVLGVEAARARPHAVDLGVGMQITNICRDVLEDARRDRVYLPADRLHGAGVDPEDLVAGRADRRAVARVVADLLDLADRYYASGRAGMRFIPARPRPAIAAAARAYQAIGHRLRERSCDALAGRTVVPATEKLRHVLRAAAWSPLAPLTHRAPHRADLHRHLAGLPGTRPAPPTEAP
ncbi:MAG: phytoene/squalene synthase family protein [Myxococcota bacterium]